MIKLTIECESVSDLIAAVKELTEKQSPAFTVPHPELNYVSMGRMRELLTIAYKTPHHKIQAIKLVREMTRCGLKEAKDLVEEAGCPPYIPPTYSNEDDPVDQGMIDNYRHSVDR